jgi:hypothetical protein
MINIDARKKGNTGIRYRTRLPKLEVEIPTEKAKKTLKMMLNVTR